MDPNETVNLISLAHGDQDYESVNDLTVVLEDLVRRGGHLPVRFGSVQACFLWTRSHRSFATAMLALKNEDVELIQRLLS